MEYNRIISLWLKDYGLVDKDVVKRRTAVMNDCG